MKAVVAVLVVLLSASCLLAVNELRGNVAGPEAENARFLRFGVVECGGGGAKVKGRENRKGVDGEFPASLRVLELTLFSGRYGLGVTGFEVWAGGPVTSEYGWWCSGAFLPLRFRYSIVNRPVKSVFLYSSVPTLYAEVAAAPLSGFGSNAVSAYFWEALTERPDTFGNFYGRLSVACEVEFLGLGTGIEAGVAGWEPWNEKDTQLGPRWIVYAQWNLLRLLTGNIALTRRGSDRLSSAVRKVIVTR